MLMLTDRAAMLTLTDRAACVLRRQSLDVVIGAAARASSSP
jgi:hypothetical protein